jgi:hypothetical protein
MDIERQQGEDMKTIDERLDALEAQAEANRQNIETIADFLREMADRLSTAAGTLKPQKLPRVDTTNHIHREENDN